MGCSETGKMGSICMSEKRHDEMMGRLMGVTGIMSGWTLKWNGMD